MGTVDVILLVICLVLAVGATGAGALALRRTGRPTSLALGIGVGVGVLGAYLAGIAALVWQAVAAVAGWAGELSGDALRTTGVAILLVGIATVVMSAVLAGRAGNRPAPSTFALVSRANETPRQRRRRERREADQKRTLTKRPQAQATPAEPRAQQHQGAAPTQPTDAPVSSRAPEGHTAGSDGWPRGGADAAIGSEHPPPVADPVEVPDRPSGPTASGQLPPTAPGR